MKQNNKRLLSILLTLCMVLSLFGGTTTTVNAAVGGVTSWADIANAFKNGGSVTLANDITVPDTATADDLYLAAGKTVTLDLNGYKLDMGNQNLQISISGTLIVNDSSEEMTGKITGGCYSDTQFGGAVRVNQDGSFTLNGGNISGNRADNSIGCGAGVYVAIGGTFIMNGGCISDNHAKYNGGGVYAGVGNNYNTTVKLLGGRIENNTAASLGGGVYGLGVYGSKDIDITIGGDIVIQNNKAQGKDNNVQIVPGKLILSESPALTADARIGWTEGDFVTEAGLVVAKGANAANYLSNFVFEGNPNYFLGLKAGDTQTIYCAKQGSTVITRPAYDVSITNGTHMTKTGDSGEAEQNDLTSEMTAVVYTADKDYYFPEDYVSRITGLTGGVLNGISVIRNSAAQITVSGKPTADTQITLADAELLPEAAFADGFGNKIDDISEYIEGTTKNDRGYTFGGWYDSNGSQLTDTDQAARGMTYTAKWTKNGNIVRTSALDLTLISESNTFGAELQDGVYTNKAEGWSWNAASNTLTLDGCTIDVPASVNKEAAITLPDGATIITTDGTENTVTNGSTVAENRGIFGKGTLIIDGTGEISVTGANAGLYVDGALTVKAPITAKATNAIGQAVYAKSVNMDDALCMKTPADGEFVLDGNNGGFIAHEGDTVPVNHVTIGVAEHYTIAFETNGGGAASDVTAKENNKLVESGIPIPTKSGYTFLGWCKDKELTTLWNFDIDRADKEMTLYAKWAKDKDIVNSISGYIQKKISASGTENVKGAKVVLKKGTEELATAVTDEDGKYSFDNVPEGEYNIVVEKKENGKTVTKTALVTVSAPIESGAQPPAIENVVLPEKTISSVVEVKDGAPAVLVGGLEKVAEGITGVSDSDDVKVTLSVETIDEKDVPGTAAGEIKDIANGKKLEYLDMAILQKIITTSGGSTTTTEADINDTTNALEIVVPFQTSGKNSITVYRHHEAAGADAETNAFEKLEQRPTENYQDGTYFVGDGFLVIYTQKFSTYAIGYNTYSGGSTAAQKPEITVNGEGKTELSKDGKTMTIIPNEGYEIKSVLVNGKDMGKVDKLTGLKTGDKVVVIFSKIAQEPVDVDSQIRQQLSKAQLKARSSFTANRNVKVVFETDKQTKTLLEDIQKAGYTVKYKYTRSTKSSAKKYAASYKQMLTKFTKTYLNTYGKKSTMYYYRVSIMVYDKDGKFVAKTDINQCRYANRLWSK